MTSLIIFPRFSLANQNHESLTLIKSSKNSSEKNENKRELYFEFIKKICLEKIHFEIQNGVIRDSGWEILELVWDFYEVGICPRIFRIEDFCNDCFIPRIRIGSHCIFNEIQARFNLILILFNTKRLR